jgi:tripartite ATP-independent transporter DctM subunit
VETFIFLALSFFLLLLLGVPIAFSMGLSTLLTLLWRGEAAMLLVVPQNMVTGVDIYVLVAVPFFILAGDIMGEAGFTRQLVAVANTLVGHLRGGLAHVVVVAEIFLSGITGSAVADTAAIGRVLIPSMKEEGYDVDFAAAVTAAAGIMGPIIPPSIVMIVYAAVMQTSVAALFAAGIVPGLIMALGLMLVSYSIAKKRQYPIRGQRASGREILVAIRKATIPLMMPVIILFGILGGIFTPTEAAAVAVAYGLIVGFAGRWLRWRELGKVLSATVVTSAMILLIIACARLMGWMLVIEMIPQKTGEFLLALTTNKYMYLLIVNLFLFVVGMFMDPGVAIIVLGPILEPVAVKLGVHPLHFAIVMVVNLSIAQLTPPVGYVLYVASSIAKISLDRLVRAVWPFILVEIAVCFLITYAPVLPMSVPMLLGYYR